MKHIFFLLTALATIGFSPILYASEPRGFYVDISRQQLLERYDYRTFNDLAVGESIIVSNITFCWVNSLGKLKIVSSEIIDERPHGITVTRIDDGSVSIENLMIPKTSENPIDTNLVVRRFEPFPCYAFERIMPVKTPFLNIRTVNGETRLSDLINIDE